SNLGGYSVVVGNGAGSVLSATASLAFSGGCASPPLGIVAWWRGETNANDSVGTNNGAFTSASYTNGEVGRAFVLDSGANVKISAAPAVNLGAGLALTVEGWLYPYDTAARPFVEWGTSGGYGTHVWINYPSAGYVWVNLYDIHGTSHTLQS